MSVTGGLLAFGVRHVFDVSAERLIELIEKRLTDHSQALPKALAKANDQAWQAVGLALAGDGLFERVRDVFRDADLKGVRDQIKKFLDQTPTGLENATADLRLKAMEEWSRLRKEGRFAADTVPAAELARRAATMERYGDPAQMAASALRVVKETAEAVRAEAPFLADLLTAAPNGGMPLLAAAFAFFFRRELESNAELAHGLSFDYLRQISERQEHGLDLLDIRTSGILEQIAVRFDALEGWFEAQDAKRDECSRSNPLPRNEGPSSDAREATPDGCEPHSCPSGLRSYAPHCTWVECSGTGGRGQASHALPTARLRVDGTSPEGLGRSDAAAFRRRLSGGTSV